MPSVKRERPPSFVFSVDTDTDTDTNNDNYDNNGLIAITKSSRSFLKPEPHKKTTSAGGITLKDERIDPSLTQGNEQEDIKPLLQTPSRRRTKSTTNTKTKTKVNTDNRQGARGSINTSTSTSTSASAKARMAEIIFEIGMKSYDKALVEHETGLTKAQQIEMLKRGRGSMYKALMGFASTL